MGTHSQIRGQFMRSYAEKHLEYVKSSWAMIEKRNDEHRALNRTYGYFEDDGTAGIGCKSHVDVEYKRRYDEIESLFRGPYDRNLPGLYDWCKMESMTIFEYLFIDNLHDEHLKTVAEESSKKEDWQMNYLWVKARLFVDELKSSHSVGEINRLIDIELQHHRYAALRCRKMLEIRPWELMKQKTLLDYRREWKMALKGSFANLTAR